MLLSGASFAVQPQTNDAAKVGELASVPEQDESEDTQTNDTVLIGAAELTRFQLGPVKNDWGDLIKRHVPELSSSAEAQSLTPGLLRKVRIEITSILSTEGYFSPRIHFARQGNDAKLIRVDIDAGLRSVVQAVSLEFSGALADAASAGQPAAVQRRDALISNWSLAKSRPFRDSEWRDAKDQLLENLRSDTYAGATIADSQATIDAAHQSAALSVQIDSGPPFFIGEVNFIGLQRYPAWLLERYSPPEKGQPYSRLRLLEYQRVLQNSPYFSTVAVSIDADSAQAEAVPVEVKVVERHSRDLGFGAGYSTNTGFRAEVSYRDRNILDRAWDLHTAYRAEQKRQLAYADIYLPPRVSDQIDSFGVLFDNLDLAGLAQTRSAIGVKRTHKRGHLEQRLGLNLTLEKNQLDGEAVRKSKALVSSIGWTWRDVDDSFAPRQGQILQLDLSASAKEVISDKSFIRIYSKYQLWIPVGKTDSILLRAEAGKILSPNVDGIPEDYLFRTGGSTTVRGYAYQSLGVQHPEGVSGGRVLAVASAEYLHWFDASWGGAGFVDVGDAAESWPKYSARQAYGIGARYRTPAGPIALDLAYGRQTQKFRLEFSIAIAF